MAIWGLTSDDYTDGTPEAAAVLVWPDNVQAINLFIAVGTQWRVGPSGAYGLDYGVLYQKMARMGLSPADFDRLEDEIRVLENAALDEMRKD